MNTEQKTEVSTSSMTDMELMSHMRKQSGFLQQAQKNIANLQAELDRRVDEFENQKAAGTVKGAQVDKK